MNRLKEKKHYKFVIIRFIITILLVVAFFMTSNTFAYFASGVEGTNTASTSTFGVGFPLYDNHEFVLNDELDTYQYIVALDDLLIDPQNNSDDVVFGIVWDDQTLFDQYGDQDISADIEVSYELLITQNGKEVNRNVYFKYAQLINIEIDIDNPSTINYNDLAETFEFSVSLSDGFFSNDYSALSRYEISVVVTYTVNEDSIVYND